QTRKLAQEKPEFAKYVEVVQRYRRDITTALSTPYLFNLVRAFDVLVKDPGVKDPGGKEDPARPSMPALWAEPAMRGLAEEIKEFREAVLFGDPLVVARRYGRGRTVAVLTTAGTSSGWNDWGGGSPASWSYQVFMMDLARY